MKENCSKCGKDMEQSSTFCLDCLDDRLQTELSKHNGRDYNFRWGFKAGVEWMLEKLKTTENVKKDI